MVEFGGVNALHYVTSEAALIEMTRSLASEGGREGICVNSVMPGSIRSPSEEELHPGAAEHTGAEQALRQSIPRWGEAKDVAGPFVFLASADSDFIAGQVVVVDDGWVNY